MVRIDALSRTTKILTISQIHQSILLHEKEKIEGNEVWGKISRNHHRAAQRCRCT